MKKTFLAFMCIATLALVTACTGSSSEQTEGVKKIHLSEALQNGNTVCDPKGNVFTGEVWSDDDATFCMSVEDGTIEVIKTFHENGKVAILQKMGENEDGDDDVFTYYDEEGNEIDEDDFEENYQSVRQRMEAAWPEE